MNHLLALLLSANRRELVGAVLVAVLSGLTSAAVLAVVATGLSRLTAPSTALLATFAALVLVATATRIASQLLLLHLAQGTLVSLRMQLCGRILAAPLSELERVGAARLLATLTDDVQAVADAVQGIPFLCFSGATLAGCLAYLAWLSPGVLLATIAVMLPGVLSYQWVEGRAMLALRSARERHGALMGYLKGLIEGVKELKLHGPRRQAYLRDALEATAAATRRDVFRGMSLYSIAGAWTQLLLLVLLGVLLFALPRWYTIEPAVLSAFALTVLYMLRPVDFVLHMLPILIRAGVALEQVESLGLSLATRAEPCLATGLAGGGPRAPTTISLHGIRHSYQADDEEEPFVLGPIDLELRAGEVVLLTGGNGSGKSTLAKVLTGLYPPSAGEIRLDGRPIAPDDPESYRQLFTAIFADFHLFDRWYGLDSLAVAQGAGPLLERLHLTRQVRLGDQGPVTAGLSQGQRKRLALLTAFLEDRPVYLFDEWAADQDPHFKEVFYRELLPALRRRGKLVLVITHDDRYFDAGDRRVRLEEGRIVAT